MFLKGQKGYSLPELLVVISIVAILAAIVYANFSSAREDARDAKRISDLNEIADAISLRLLNDQVELDCQGGARLQKGGSEDLAQYNTATACADTALLQDILDDSFSGEVADPSGLDDPMFYYYIDIHGCNPQPNGLILFAFMENELNSNRDEVCGMIAAPPTGGNNEGYYNYQNLENKYPYVIRLYDT